MIVEGPHVLYEVPNLVLAEFVSDQRAHVCFEQGQHVTAPRVNLSQINSSACAAAGLC